MNHEPNTFIVSNRLPVTVKRDKNGAFTLAKSPGGLVSGLSDVHKRADALWIGFPGIHPDHEEYAEIATHLSDHRYLPVRLQEAEYKAFYNGLANGGLWPLFHYFLGQARFNEDEWKAYRRVNREFADTVLGLARPGDRVWVHDYQLMLVPAMLREALPELQIAYFHHVPFPAAEMYRAFPWRAEILQGLLGADLIGMHTLEYVMHLQSSVARLLGVEVERDQIHYEGRLVRLGAFPLGVDGESIRACVRGLSNEGRVAELAKAAEGKTVFLGIDRLDYTKGIPERLRAFSLFLKQHPDVVGQVMLVQVCVPSREDVQSYVELRADVERLVGQINGEHSAPGYVPLHYLYQPFSPEEVRQFYKLGDIALVTPLRDGLNLVCKEYVASRDDDEGILILSEFAGAAAEMGEALLVNPFDVGGMAKAMHKALMMPAEERRRRMRPLRGRIALNDNIEWSRDFMRAWIEAPLAASGRHSQHLEGQVLTSVLEKLVRAPKRFLFIDYDGTLVPIRNKPDLALPSVSTLRLLHRLSSLPGTEVAVITGRSRDFCEQYFTNLKVSVAAEHSGFFRLRGEKAWHAASDPREFERIKHNILPHLESYVSRIPGSMIEEKATALVLHYREAESVFAHRQAYDLRESLCRMLANTPFSAFQAKRAIEVKPISANKGYAVEKFLRDFGHSTEAFLTVGDDRTDEDMFVVEPERNQSVFVGHTHMIARYHLDTPEELAEVLELLVERLAIVKSERRPLPNHRA